MAVNYRFILTLEKVGLNDHGNSRQYCFITLAPGDSSGWIQAPLTRDYWSIVQPTTTAV